MDQFKHSSYNLVISGHQMPISVSLGVSLLFNKLAKQAEDRIPQLEFLDDKYKGTSVVYGLRFDDNSIYVGHAPDFTKRMLQHLGVKFGPKAKPVEGTEGKKVAAIEFVKVGDEAACKVHQMMMAMIYGKEQILGGIKVADTEYSTFTKHAMGLTRENLKEEATETTEN